MSAMLTPTIAKPTGQPLLTAEEFVAQYEGQRVELVNGIVEEMPMPTPKHGKITLKFGRWLGNWVEEKDLGHVVSNDSWININSENVRGPDLFYISYARQPKGPLPDGLLEQSPELAVEVKSPSDSWKKLEAEARLYLEANVIVVVLIDPKSQTATIFRDEEPATKLTAEQELTIPDLLPGFSVNVGKLFD